MQMSSVYIMYIWLFHVKSVRVHESSYTVTDFAAGPGYSKLWALSFIALLGYFTPNVKA